VPSGGTEYFATGTVAWVSRKLPGLEWIADVFAIFQSRIWFELSAFGPASEVSASELRKYIVFGA
jgi:hypothetical protein